MKRCLENERPIAYKMKALTNGMIGKMLNIGDTV